MKPDTTSYGRVIAANWAGAVLPVAVVAIMVLLMLFVPNFSSSQNVTNVLRGASLLLIVACGQMLVMIVGGLDLSIGACMALSSVTCALVMTMLSPAYPDAQAITIAAGIGCTLMCGLAVGLVNGICSAVLGIPSLIVTLGTSSAAAGLALLLTSGVPIYGLPGPFVEFAGRTAYFGLPGAVWVALALLSFLFVLQNLTRFGVRLLATGGNEHAAIVSGIATWRYQLAAYVCSGLFASVTSLLLTAQIGSGQSSIGDRLTLESIAAAVIGGVSIRGGTGKAERVALAALFLLILNNMMDFLQIDSKSQMILLGIFVLITAAAGVADRRKQNA